MSAVPLKTARTCSRCCSYGHNSRTCANQITLDNNSNSNSNTGNENNHKGGIMLFGVKLTPAMENSPSPSPSPRSLGSSTSFRKCMSMGNLAQYQQQQIRQSSSGSGYVSDDSLHASASQSRDRKRGTPWSEDEHRLFLVGLNQVGKGDWRGISRNYVKTRTPTQVASHAQKYFLRRTNLNRRRRRSSLFDITTDTMSRSSSAGQLHNLDITFQAKEATYKPTIFSSPRPPTLPSLLPLSTNIATTTPVIMAPSPFIKIENLNLNQPPISSVPTNSTLEKKDYEPLLSLKLSQSISEEESSQPSNTFGGFNGNGDNIISVS